MPKSHSAASSLRATLLPGLRPRHDGWTDARLKVFLKTLKTTGCISDAARVAGVSAKSAYEQRDRFPAFAAAMEGALEHAQDGLLAVAHRYATQGRETVIIRKGEEVERRIAPDTATLGLLIKRGDNGTVQDPETGQFVSRSEADARGIVRKGQGTRIPPGHIIVDPATVITQEEQNRHIVFDGYGKKINDNSNESARYRMMKKLDLMHERIVAAADREGICMKCKQPLPLGQSNVVILPDSLMEE